MLKDIHLKEDSDLVLTTGPLQIDACVDSDLIQPGTHLGIPSEQMDRAVDFDKHLLGDIFGIVMIPEDIIGQAVDFLFIRINESLKGVDVSITDPVCKCFVI